MCDEFSQLTEETIQGDVFNQVKMAINTCRVGLKHIWLYQESVPNAKACWGEPELHVMILCVVFFFVDSRRHESLLKLQIATAN